MKQEAFKKLYFYYNCEDKRRKRKENGKGDPKFSLKRKKFRKKSLEWVANRHHFSARPYTQLILVCPMSVLHSLE